MKWFIVTNVTWATITLVLRTVTLPWSHYNCILISFSRNFKVKSLMLWNETPCQYWSFCNCRLLWATHSWLWLVWVMATSGFSLIPTFLKQGWRTCALCYALRTPLHDDFAVTWQNRSYLISALGDSHSTLVELVHSALLITYLKQTWSVQHCDNQLWVSKTEYTLKSILVDGHLSVHRVVILLQLTCFITIK